MPKLSELVSKKDALHHVKAAVPKSQSQLICGNEGKYKIYLNEKSVLKANFSKNPAKKSLVYMAGK